MFDPLLNDGSYTVVILNRDGEPFSLKCDEAWSSDAVLKALQSGSFIALQLSADSDDANNFSQFHQIKAIPSIFFINASTGTLLKEVHGGAAADSTKIADTINSLGKNPRNNIAPATTSNMSAKKEEARVKALEIQRKLKEKQAEKRIEAQRLAKEKEIERRKEGQALAVAKKQREELAAKKEAEELAEAARSAKAARKLAAEARARAQNRSQGSTVAVSNHQKKPVAEDAKPISKAKEIDTTAKKIYSYCKLSFRLPDEGGTIKCTFPADSKLQAAREFVVESEQFKAVSHGLDFVLKTTFPLALLDQYDRTLQDLMLVPSAQLGVHLVHKKDNNEGMCDWFKSLLQYLNPLSYSMFQATGSAAATRSLPTPSRVPTEQQPRRPGLRAFRNEMDDDDPEKRKSAFNGDSTQTLQ